MAAIRIIASIVCIVVVNTSAAEEFDIGSFMDDVLTATNDEWLAGSYDVTIHVNTHNNHSLEGKPFRLFPKKCGQSRYGGVEGTIEAGNIIRADGLVGGLDAVVYTVYADQNEAGYVSIEDSRKEEPVEVYTHEHIGAPAPSLTVSDIQTGGTIRIADFHGEVTFIIFWVISEPCRKPMAESEEIMSRNSDIWEGRARIVGVNLDHSVESLKHQIAEKGWTNIYHTWGGDWNEDNNQTVKQYLINSGVPEAILIDAKGVIRWRGYPGSINIEGRIEKLLAEALQ